MSVRISEFPGTVDLASELLGGEALLASDEFFAEKENLLRADPAVFVDGRFTERGKWMDGWESRRRRVPGHDWCIVKLGAPGIVRCLDIDTSHFLGNAPPYASVDATCVDVTTPASDLRDSEPWTEILPPFPLKPGSHNVFPIADDRLWTHVRLNIYPAGGVARFRVHGQVVPDPELLSGPDAVDLACLRSGGRAVACSDMFFAPMEQLLLPGRAPNMGGGWETRRSNDPSHEDWIVVELGHPGLLERVAIDTLHFKGNFPQRASLDGLYWPDAPTQLLVRSPDWTPILSDKRLGAHAEHSYDRLLSAGPFTHVRLRIRPDGGVSRLRVFGRPQQAHPSADRVLGLLNNLDDEAFARKVTAACGSERWAQAMAEARPFHSRTQLLGTAEHVWWRLSASDWLEAFSHHPRIGDLASLKERFGEVAGALSEREQAGLAGAEDDTLRALADGNQAYMERFGFLFLVCAKGLSAAELLERLNDRLGNDPLEELEIAAAEQVKITRLRLAGLELPA